MIFDALALVSLLTVITMIRRLVGIFPSIMSCMVRWKENLALQHSLRTRTDRDIFATAMLVPFVLTAYRFRMYCPDFMQGMNEDARLGLTFAHTSPCASHANTHSESTRPRIRPTKLRQTP